MAFAPGLRRTDLVSAATIPVERIHGAVLLISAADDQGYSVALHDVAAQRLAAHDHLYSWRHVVYEPAGHQIAKPLYPDHPLPVAWPVRAPVR